MPSWWMPASCANALRPTTALFAWTLLPHNERHHDLLERRVARALANPVDRAFDLARAALYRRDRVGDREAKVVVAMRAEGHLVGVRYARPDRREEVTGLVGRRIANRIREVD